MPCFACSFLLGMFIFLNVGSRKRKSNENNWESGIDSNMKERFIELCLQELDNSGKLGETLKSSSWMHIAKEIKHDFGDCYSVAQLNKKMKVMEKQYQICASITNKIGHCYDATGSSKISSPVMREKYQKVIVNLVTSIFQSRIGH